MKTILFFGSFNPIHTGHLIMASFVRNLPLVEEVWMIVSPKNPFKSPDKLWDDKVRLELVSKSTKGLKGVRTCDIEFSMSLPSYTWDTLQLLKKQYPRKEFILLLGSDSARQILEWKNGRQIIDLYEVWVYPRQGQPCDLIHSNLHSIPAPVIELSSTLIRKLIEEGKQIKWMVPPPVEVYIKKNNPSR